MGCPHRPGGEGKWMELRATPGPVQGWREEVYSGQEVGKQPARGGKCEGAGLDQYQSFQPIAVEGKLLAGSWGGL